MNPYLGHSIALHVAVMTAVITVSDRKAAPKSPVYTIDFVGPTAVVSPGAGEKGGPALEAASAEKPALPPDRDEFGRKKRKPFTLPKPSLLKGWRKKAASAPPPAAAAGDAQAEPGEQGGAAGSAGIATDMPNFPYPWYITQIRTLLWNRWSQAMPAAAGSAVIVFTLLPDGRMVDLKVESSSGDSGFDLAALACAEDAGPYPALPTGFEDPFLKIHVTLAGGSQ